MPQASEYQVTAEDMAYVVARVADAVRTCRHMPAELVRAKMTSWPDFVKDYWRELPDALPPRVAPTPQQITRMDEVILHWLPYLARVDSAYPRIVWAHGKGYGFRRIAAVLKCSKSTAHTHHLNAVYLVAARYVKK